MSLDGGSRGEEFREARTRERLGASTGITPQELRLLTEIEGHLRREDPRLAARLTTGRREQVQLHLRAHRGVLSLVSGLGGIVLMVMFFMHLLAVALVGAAMLGAAIGAQAQPAARAARRCGRELACRTARLGTARHH